MVVRNRLEQLRKRQRDEALQAQEELLEGVASIASKGKFPPPTVEPAGSRQVVEEDVEPYERGMSPDLVDITKLPHEERQVDIVLESDDIDALVGGVDISRTMKLTIWAQMKLRRSVADSRFISKAPQPAAETADVEESSGADLASEALYRAEAERDMDEEEELFNLEENIARPTAYNWEDKYRPRKPRYFNRVHTGYEWNKYNQTHYECVPHVFSRSEVLMVA